MAPKLALNGVYYVTDKRIPNTIQPFTPSIQVEAYAFFFDTPTVRPRRPVVLVC